jgi:hypothetical protein
MAGSHTVFVRREVFPPRPAKWFDSGGEEDGTVRRSVS